MSEETSSARGSEEQGRKWQDGDVIWYPGRGWMREGMAIRIDGSFYDTYWGLRRDEFSKFVSDEQAAEGEFRFNVNEFEPFKGGEEAWETYPEADRGIVTEQHGCYRRFYVRPGAEPSGALRVAQAERKVVVAEQDARLAQSKVEWARQDLARVREEVSAHA